MESSAEKLHVYRKRIARIVRRVEAQPPGRAHLLRHEIDALLVELRRLARPEPAVVVEVLLVLLDRIAQVADRLEEPDDLLGETIPAVLDPLRRIFMREGAAGGASFDRNRALERLFDRWAEDEHGHFEIVGPLLLEVSVTRGDEATLRLLLKGRLQRLPLPFPNAREPDADLGRVVLVAERHRLERLLGEVLARGGQHDLAIAVARDHYRRTGDAYDLVTVLRRAGRGEDAISVARRALTSPRCFQREALREMLDDLLTGIDGPSGDRDRKRVLEERFLCDPGLKTFHALRAAVPADQWSRVRQRVLGHLHKHQKAPTLLFNLYLEEGDLVEADGLAVTQPVAAQDLEVAAYRFAPDHAEKAAGWLLIAAHRRAHERRPASDQQVVRNLLDIQQLSRHRGEEESFRRALTRFRAHVSRRPRLLRLLDAAGLVLDPAGG